MKLEELLCYTSADVSDIDRLMHELSATSFCNEEILDRIMRDENSHLYVLRVVSEGSNEFQKVPGGIVGCACLCVSHTPEFTLGFVESVTVLSDYRGQHLGRKLMEHLMSEAKRLGVQHLHLTSNPKRVAANGLYEALGFKKYDTNCYTMSID